MVFPLITLPMEVIGVFVYVRHYNVCTTSHLLTPVLQRILVVKQSVAVFKTQFLLLKQNFPSTKTQAAASWMKKGEALMEL